MVRTLLKSAILAGLIVVVVCGVALAQYSSANDIWYPWWDRTPNVTYYWDDWTSIVGSNPYAVAPDVIGPSGGGTGSAVVKVEEPGASLMEGVWDGFGTKTNFWDLGPGGSINIDVDTNAQGMLFWVQVTYHDGMAGTPTVNVANAQQLNISRNVFELRQVVESTGLPGDSEAQQWVTYMSLWRLDPGAVFSGIDISTGDGGAVIDSVIVDARVLPEPTAVVLAVFGNCALFAFRRYRRK